MQAWADRNADAIGAKLAEHTFGHALRRPVPERLRQRQGHPRRRPQAGWGGAQAGHFKAIFAEATKPGGFGVSYFEGLLGVGALHSRINLPLKWFLGTYPVFIDLVHEAMLADTPEPARVTKRSFGRSSESVDLTVLAAAERAINRVFNYDSQAIVEAFYYDTFTSMGVNLKTMGEAGPGRDISDLFADVRNTMHETLKSFNDSTFVVQEMCSGMNRSLSETGQADQRAGAERVARRRGRRPPGRRRHAGPQGRRPGHGRRDRRHRALAATASTPRWRPPPRSTTPAPASRTPRPRSPRSPAARSRSAASSRRSRTSPARPTCSRSTPRSRPPAPVRRGKGFAVVADEVRQLAERAAQSAADAGELIAGIQAETNDAVELVRDAANRTHAGTEASDRARTTLEEIDGAVGRITLELGGMSQLTTRHRRLRRGDRRVRRADVGDDAADQRLHAGDRHRPSSSSPRSPRRSRGSRSSWNWHRRPASRRPARRGCPRARATGRRRPGAPSLVKASSARPIGSSRSITRAPMAASTLRASACAQTAPKRPVEVADDRGRLVAQRRVGQRAREPVQRVLELARDRVVVLGRGDEHRVGLARSRRSSACTASGRVCSSSSSNGGIGLQAVEDDRARPRAAAGRPPPGGAWRCGSRRAGCRRGRGRSSGLRARQFEVDDAA